jgi:hypothetical protein
VDAGEDHSGGRRSKRFVPRVHVHISDHEPCVSILDVDASQHHAAFRRLFIGEVYLPPLDDERILVGPITADDTVLGSEFVVAEDDYGVMEHGSRCILHRQGSVRRNSNEGHHYQK